MSGAGTLVVGAGQTGLELAVALRGADPARGITLVGAETHPPWQSQPLSKGVLSSDVAADALSLRSAQFYAEQRIDVVTGDRVVRLDHSASGGVAHTALGRSLPYAQLALTTGARARQLRVPGADRAGVVTLRELGDARRLRHALEHAREIVVVGGGFIGLEVAAAAYDRGVRVCLVETGDRLVGQAVGEPMARFYADAHRRRGADIRLCRQVVEVTGSGDEVDGVRLDDGSHVPAQLVVVGIGVIPRTELAESIGLRCDHGVVVDEFCRTSDPAVVAAGDNCVFPDPRTGHGLVRLQSVQNSVDQARVAASTLAGAPAPYRGLPRFWSDQGDLHLQIAGLSTGHDQAVTRGDVDAEQFTVLYYRAGRLIAVEAVNRVADYSAGRLALSRGLTISPERAADPATKLKDLLS